MEPGGAGLTMMVGGVRTGATLRKTQTKTGPDCSGFTAEQPANDAIRQSL